jgi:hypothetical protein
MFPFKPDEERPDMMARRAAGMKLVTDAIALEIARLVLTKEHGDDELKRQLPLFISADADTWVVRGSRPTVTDNDVPQLDGPFEMRISQFTGQIFSCCFLFVLNSRKK